MTRTTRTRAPWDHVEVTALRNVSSGQCVWLLANSQVTARTPHISIRHPYALRATGGRPIVDTLTW